jgi:hypothetical protein
MQKVFIATLVGTLLALALVPVARKFSVPV